MVIPMVSAQPGFFSCGGAHRDQGDRTVLFGGVRRRKDHGGSETEKVSGINVARLFVIGQNLFGHSVNGRGPGSVCRVDHAILEEDRVTDATDATENVQAVPPGALVLHWRDNRRKKATSQCLMR